MTKRKGKKVTNAQVVRATRHVLRAVTRLNQSVIATRRLLRRDLLRLAGMMTKGDPR